MMLARRWVVVGLVLIGVGAMAQEGSKEIPMLIAGDNIDIQTEKLRAALVGQPMAELDTTLRQMGAQNPSLQDIANLGLPDGTELVPGIRAGDPIVTAIFSIPRGLFRTDLRLRIFLSYNDDKITGLKHIEAYAK